jgi:hypothetical protein
VADEDLYCYCNQVSYGEMVACDGDGCEREWFHLECVGLKVAPKGNGELRSFFLFFLSPFFSPLALLGRSPFPEGRLPLSVLVLGMVC